MHKKKAIELGLRLYDVPEIAARAASGPMSMNQSAVATIDYGVVVANTIFAICDLDSFSPDLILLGSNALRDLGMIANFETNMVYIKQKYPIRMYTNRESAEQHIMQIKREFISLSAIEVKTEKNILVPSHSEKSVDISMSRLESVQLENTFTFFTSDGYLLNGPITADQVIDESFPWRSQAFKIKLVNNTDKDKLVLKGSVLGVLRPLASRALAQKLGDEQLSDVHVLEPITGDIGNIDADEEVFLNTMFDDLICAL